MLHKIEFKNEIKNFSFPFMSYNIIVDKQVHTTNLTYPNIIPSNSTNTLISTCYRQISKKEI